MTLPRSSLRFRHLIIRTAEQLGCAYYGDDNEGIAQLPVNAHDLDRCKRIVNDAYAGFASSIVDPITGKVHIWSFTRQHYELTFRTTAVEGVNTELETHRYIMPWYFSGEVYRDWAYASDQSTSAYVRVVSVARIEEMWTGQSGTTGTPSYCGFRALPMESNEAASGRRFEAVFYPAPSQALTLNITLRATPEALWDLDDIHFAGRDHDETVRRACIAQAELDQLGMEGDLTRAYYKKLHDSIELDLRVSAPRSLGFNLDRANYDDDLTTPPYKGTVDSYNGSALSGP